MKTKCNVVSSQSLIARGETLQFRRKSLTGVSLAVLIVLALGSRAMGGPLIVPPVQVPISDIGAHGSVSYSFNQSTGPLAFDFARANDPNFTTAQYVFNGTVENTPGGTPVFAQWSPALNATGGFVPFLGNDKNGNAIAGKDAQLKPTKVAYITDANGKQYGYIKASFVHSGDNDDDDARPFGGNQSNNTKFTFVNTSKYAIDPALAGEQIGVVIPEQFIGTIAVNKSANVNYTSATDQGGGGFTVSSISGTTTSGSASAQTLTLTASQSFSAISSAVPDSLTLTGGSVRVLDTPSSANSYNPLGGSGSINLSATITKGSSTIQTLSFQAIKFATTGTTFPQTFTFSTHTLDGALTGLSGNYTVTTKWTFQFTPKDKTATATADPHLIFSFDSEPFIPSVPVPPTFVLAGIGGACLIGFHLVSRRSRRRNQLTLAA
jgi:hypothetical protein